MPDQLMPDTRMDSWMFKIMTNLHIDEIRAVSARASMQDRIARASSG